MQHDFRYVSKEQAKELKKELRNLIHDVQNEVREYFTFQYRLIGSASRDMITYDAKSNKGFDFDVNFYVNDDEERFAPEEIRQIFFEAIRKISIHYGYSKFENSTRVITIKQVNYFWPRIEYSCDFAIVYDCPDGRQQYIRYNKNRNTYTWEYQSNGYPLLEEKMKWIKQKGLWKRLEDYYIEKKNHNEIANKKSRAIFAEAVHEICMKNGYKR